ncbi:hypothetical protein GCM10023201_56730 [Actinomycetospora corticicola]
MRNVETRAGSATDPSARVRDVSDVSVPIVLPPRPRTSPTSSPIRSTAVLDLRNGTARPNPDRPFSGSSDGRPVAVSDPGDVGTHGDGNGARNPGNRPDRAVDGPSPVEGSSPAS